MDIADMFAQLQMKKGIVKDLFARFHTVLGPRIPRVMVQFNELNTLEDKFAFIWNLPEAQQFLIPPKFPAVKLGCDAEQHRLKGNIFYKCNQLDDALKWYNQSILLAPHPKLNISTASCECACERKGYETLAFGYANRSAFFLRVKEYKKCLSDIDLALECGYPESLRSKLTERREACLNAQKHSVRNNTEPETISINAKIPPVLLEPNQTIPSFSDALKLAYSPARGRHVVAARDILPGELLAVEKSYCSITQMEKLAESCCSVCFMKCCNPVPCPNCTHWFCSDTCRTKGLKGNHGKECRIHQIMSVMGLADTFAEMALKILLHTPFDELKEKLPLLQKETKELSPEKRGFNENGIYSSTDYRSVYHIASETQRSEEDIYKKCLIAFVLTKLLYNSENFFTNMSGLPLNPNMKDIMVTGTLLLHHLFDHPVYIQSCEPKINTVTLETVRTRLGWGLFPSLQLMKHSCNPSAVLYDIDNVGIVKSMTLIPAGKEVTLQYCQSFQKAPIHSRKIELEHVGIRCSCEACEDNWPTFNDLPKICFKCVKCSKPLNVYGPTCFTCDINYGKFDYEGEKKSMVEKYMSIRRQVEQAGEKFKDLAVKITMEQSVTKDLKDFDAVCKYIVLLERHVQLPCKALCKARDILYMYYLLE